MLRKERGEEGEEGEKNIMYGSSLLGNKTKRTKIFLNVTQKGFNFLNRKRVVVNRLKRMGKFYKRKIFPAFNIIYSTLT